MIKANELRIKNYVYDDENIIVQVEQIQSKELSDWNTDEIKIITSVGDAMYDTEFDKINPIQLTKERILNLGFFKHVKFKNTYCKGSFSIKITDSGVIYFKYNDFVIAELQFIHQLQNLFFSLCGEELVFSSTE